MEKKRDVTQPRDRHEEEPGIVSVRECFTICISFGDKPRFMAGLVYRGKDVQGAFLGGSMRSSSAIWLYGCMS